MTLRKMPLKPSHFLLGNLRLCTQQFPDSKESFHLTLQLDCYFSRRALPAAMSKVTDASTLNERTVGDPLHLAGVTWKDVPAGTKSVALILHDPDAPGKGSFTHWVVYDMDTGQG
jgi:hypothetical protein